MKRLVIVGAGAIGGCIGGLLNQGGLDVVLVARGAHGDHIRKHGLSVRFPTRTILTKPLCLDAIANVDWKEGDAVLVSTKLNDATKVFEQLALTVGNEIPVICGFNGMQGERWAQQGFENVVSMFIWMRSAHLFPGDVRVYGKTVPGVLDVGPIQGSNASNVSEELACWLSSVGFESICRSDMLLWKRAKWITNLGNTAQAMIVDDWLSILKLAQKEGESILDELGIDRVPTSQLLERAKNVVLDEIDGERRAGGSTWQSFQRGKPLETEWIEGAMADLAESRKLHAPVNRGLSVIAQQGLQMTATQFLNRFCQR